MKLLHVATFRLSLLAAVLMGIWSVLFFMTVMDEVNDEVDDSLEDYAEAIMLRALRGEPLPTGSSGSNNQYFLRPVSAEYADSHAHVRYEDRSVYIREKHEHEPARVFTQIYRRDDGGWMELEVSTPNIEKSDLRRAITLWMSVLYAGLMLVAFVLNYWGMRRCMRPLYRLLDWLTAYRLGSTNEPLVNPTGISEFRQLNEAAQQSMARNEELHELQRQFIANASHELQTPIAVCQNRIELLIDDDTDPLTEHQMGELLKVRQTLERLSRLNRSLLLLCKIEGGQFADTAVTDLAAIVRRLLPDYEELYASRRHITTTCSAEASAPHWQMDESLATALVANLLKNAYLHNRTGGSVSITLASQRLTIANTGTDDSPLDAEAIFRRFSHSPGHEGSTGLGLPIVSAICARYGLCIDYRFANGRHVFAITRKPALVRENT